MTKYEAETKKQYLVNGKLRTAKQFIEYNINTTWLYSIHWKNESWIKSAKVDCLDRIASVKKDLNCLEASFKLLESIEDI